MKKILIIVNSAKFFVSHRQSVAIEAQEKGFEVLLAFPDTNDEIKRNLEINDLNFKVIKLTRSGTNIIKEIFSFLSILKLILKEKPDLIHLVTIKPVLYGGLISKILKIPTLIAISGLGYMYSKGGNKVLRFFADRAYRLILSNRCLKVIVQNKKDKLELTKFSNINESDISLLPGSGVNLKEFKYSIPPQQDKIFLMPCRMLWDKGIKEYVDAASKLKDKYNNVNFILSGPYDASNPGSVSLDYLHKLNEFNIVNWLGDVKDMPKLYEGSSVVVVPSFYNEGLPKVLLEAAASGRAAITTDMPGCKDAIEENVTGLIIPKQDSNALYSAMEKFIMDEWLILSMGESARIKAENEFDIKYVVNKHISIYRDLSKL